MISMKNLVKNDDFHEKSHHSLFKLLWKRIEVKFEWFYCNVFVDWLIDW